jgi:hypothetical protein
MSEFENVPAVALADAARKLVARMNDADVASSLQTGLVSMPDDALRALVDSIFQAFRDRGESSEDAAEGAQASLAALIAGEQAATRLLLTYASENSGLLKDAFVLFVERHRELLHALPGALGDGVAEILRIPYQ